MFFLSLMVVFLLLIIIAGLAALETKDLLGAVIIFSSFSFLAVMLYLLLGSPDVAFTEAVIGVISSIFFIFAIKRLDRWCD
jgi:multicomponent Na+:H+ antiporter subunit B